MAGIAALGVAAGAFSKGYMEGEKHRSEMEDAETRRGLIKLQSEKMELENKAARKKQSNQDELDSIVQEYLPRLTGSAASSQPDAQVPVTTPVAPAAAPATTDASAPRMGIGSPGAAAAAPATAPAAPQKSPWDLRQEMFNRLNIAALKSAETPDQLQKAMDTSLSMMKKFRDAKTDEALSAMQTFASTGDQAQAEAIMANAGLPMPQGSTWKMEKRPIFPGSKTTMDDVVVTSPDGKTVSMNQIMMSRMDPKDYFASNLKVAEVQSQAAYQQGMLEETKRYHDIMANNSNAHLIIAREQTKVMQQNADLANKKFNFDAVQAMNSKAAEEVSRLVGVPKDMTADERLKYGDKEAAAYDARRQGALNRAATIMANYGLNNRRASDGNELVPVSLVNQATNVAKTTPDQVKSDDGVNYYVKIGDRQVFVLPPVQKQPAPAAPAAATPGAPATAAPAAPRAGLQTPSIVDVETREIELGRRRDYSPAAKAEMQRQQAASEQAAQQQLVEEQQRQLASSRGIAAQYR